MSSDNKYIWYVCYGSNLAIERLYCYFNNQASKRLHISKGYLCPSCPNPQFENKQFIIRHPIYFANENDYDTANWGKTGVAFLDMSKDGFAYGRAYKMTEECFEHLRNKEGRGENWYNDPVLLGIDEDGHEIRTLTNKRRLKKKKPCDNYLEVIKIGLLEIGVSEEEANKYISNIINDY